MFLLEMAEYWRRPVSELLAKRPADFLCDVWEYQQRSQAEEARDQAPREYWQQ
jgi:hypothetical protein